MNWQFTPYAVPLIVGGVILWAIAALAWQRRSMPGAWYLFGLACLLPFYVVGYAFEIGSTRLAEVLTWLKIEYIGAVIGPPLLLMLALAYTGRQRYLTLPVRLLILLIPLMTLIFAWTNDLHGLVWQDISLDASGGFTRTLFNRGGFYWVNSIYVYLILVVGAVLFGQAFWRAHGLYRRQNGIILIGLLIPLAVYIAYILKLSPPGLDLNPYALVITSVCVAQGLFYYQLFDLAPVAREAVLASMGDAVIVLDAQNRVVDLNAAAQQLVGVDLSRAAGRPAAAVFPAWDEAIGPAGDSQQAAAEATVTVAGQPRAFDVRTSPLHSPRGRYGGRVIVLHDLTERVAVEDALREANERLQTLRRVDADLVRKLDVSFVATMALDAAVRMSLADAAFIGLAVPEGVRIIHALGQYRQEAINTLLPLDRGISVRVIRTREPVLILDVTQDPDYFPIVADTRAQITVPLLSQEKLIGVLMLETAHPQRFTPDIFEAIKLLATRVAVAIDNAHMYEERQKLIGELEAFAHTVAHDLKNPLNVIKGYADLLLMSFDSLSPETLRNHLEQVSRGVDRANDIIHALLLLAGVRTTETVDIGPLDMGAVIARVQERLQRLIEQHEGQIALPDAWPVALGYAPWVEEIWDNYVSNALKYGGRPPCVALGADPPQQGRVRYWVRDNGAGLTLQEQAQLFRPFTRLRQVSVQGHGLGLSIVQRIAERLGGEVGVESVVGQGSRFYFTLPVGPPAAPPGA